MQKNRLSYFEYVEYGGIRKKKHAHDQQQK